MTLRLLCSLPLQKCDNWLLLLQEWGPLPGPATGLLSNTRKWIAWGDTCADNARDFIGKEHLGGEKQVKGIQENCSATGFYGDGISFWVVFSQSFWLRVLPGVQPWWGPSRRILGGAQTCRISFWPFPNSSLLWWLISSRFLTRNSCK